MATREIAIPANASSQWVDYWNGQIAAGAIIKMSVAGGTEPCIKLDRVRVYEGVLQGRSSYARIWRPIHKITNGHFTRTIEQNS